MFNSNESTDLNSTSVGLTEKCLVPLFNLRTDKTGSDEITIREPLYVFAVNVCLMVNRHSEVNSVVHCLKTSCLTAAKKLLLPIDGQRRLLVQGAHTYKHKANISTELQKRQEGLPKEITDIAWQAQLRLCRRYNRLLSRGKHRNVVVIAIAREMAAYLWAIAREVVIIDINPRLRVSRVPA